MNINYKKIIIDKELDELLPPLSEEDYKALEESLLKNGFDQHFGRIKVWFPEDNEDGEGYIIDGHNRYKICQKHNIDLSAYWNYEMEFFKSKSDVIKWMYENQLARRNLSEATKYEVIEKYSDYLRDIAKKNQSDGGKGLSNLTKVNVRKEKADRVGISEGSYHKLDKVMKSNNEEVKQQLREKKVSIDKAYRELKNTTPEKKEAISPQQQIEKFDNRMNDIDKEILSLKSERESLMRSRSSLFEALDIECELKYELENETLCRSCSFYIEVDGHRQEFVNCMVIDDEPYSLFKNRVPEKYKSDFMMLYREAHFENMERTRQENERLKKEYENNLINDTVGTIDKDFYKKCFRILAKNFHPDNGEEGNMDDMKSLNQLKIMLGI